jgi:hypothetical protein
MRTRIARLTLSAAGDFQPALSIRHDRDDP